MTHFGSIRSDTLFVSIVGICQLCAWGSQYYSFPLIAAAMEADLGWSKATIYGAATVNMLMAGCMAYLVGYAVDRAYGRVLMAGGSVVAGVLLALWSQVQSITAFYVILGVLGCVQAATLYEPAFAVVMRRLGPGQGRRGITAITLWGGFSSALFLPLLHFLMSQYGWRGALLAMAAINALPCALLYAAAIDPKNDVELNVHPDEMPPRASGWSVLVQTMRKPAYWGLMVAWIAYSFAFITLTYHFYQILLERGVTAGEAVLIFSLVGPSQVCGRVLLMLFARNASVGKIGSLTVTAFPVVVIGLWLAPADILVLGLVSIVYGAANGMIIIVRGLAVPELVSNTDYGFINGSIMGPVRILTAFAPLAAAVLWKLNNSYEAVLVMMLIGSIVLCCGFWYAVYHAHTDSDGV